MEPEFLKVDATDLEDTGLPREAPFTKEECQIQSSLLKRKSADAFNDEMSRKYPYYDKTYQSKPGRDGGNPFASKRNEDDALPTEADPQSPPHDFERTEKEDHWMGEMGIKQSTPRVNKLDQQPSNKPPREDLKNYGSEDVQDELNKENDIDPDYRVQSSLLDRDFNHMEHKSKAASLVVKSSSLKDIIASVKVNDQCLIMNVARKDATFEFTPSRIAKLENEISKALHVRAKYSHFMVSSAFDGVALEFLLC
jgi:hypothetical protein